MADNVTFQESVATPPNGLQVAADEISSVVYQRMKLIHGADGINDGDVSTENPLPQREYTSPDVIYFYDGSGNIEYICSHNVHGTATSATDWEIKKLTHGANGITNKERLIGSVDNRASLDWR